MRTENLTAEEYLVTHEVPMGYDGIRLDSFLKERYRKRSRETLKKAISSGAISIQRTQSPHLMLGELKPSMSLYAGDQVLVLSERKPEPAVSFDYKVVFEDETILVVDKPSSLPVHPAGRYFFNTLLVHLRTHGHKDPLRADREFYLVHRIDKETSGILVLAKDREVCTHLTRQFSARKTGKKYLAIVHGTPPEEFVCDLAMKRATNSIIDVKMMIAPESEGGQSALTYFKRLGIYGDYSLVECDIKTGRQHQIRLHCEAMGFPIVGDKLYGRPEEEAVRFYERKWISPEAEAKLVLPRHALHAAVIRFEHPLTGQMLEFRTELPTDLQAFLDRNSPH